MTEITPTGADLRDRILDAALPHVPFDGWSDTTFRTALAACDVTPGIGRAVFPGGAVDMAVALHRRGDAQMVQQLRAADLTGLRFRDRIAHAVKLRIGLAGDREIVRRGMTLFALPSHAPRGVAATWGTADAIWGALGDESRDHNWYTKRASLSGVFGSTVLFWLGDTSGDDAATWAFLDRRIDNVMQFEKVKARVGDNKALGRLTAMGGRLLAGLTAPASGHRGRFPGHWPVAPKTPGGER